jgi:isochorismate synthase
MTALAKTNTAFAYDAEEEPLFAFNSRRNALRAAPHGILVQPGPTHTISERVGASLRKAGPGAVIAGALPFDRASDDCLWQSYRAAPDALLRPAITQSLRWRLRAEPDIADYAASVQRALDIMSAEHGQPDALAKIVLSRSLVAMADRDIDLQALLGRLSIDPGVTGFLVPLPNKDGAQRTLVGATPELLVSKTGTAICSYPLAGSAKRQKDMAADALAASGLCTSEKDIREHAMVVEFILDTLTPYCRQLRRPEGTALTSTASMWHLGTRIEGELSDPDIPVVALAAALHPTPAVCGLPAPRAAKLISEIEAYDRDFYAGAVGWCDEHGDGAWYVTIRCAEISGRQARLYAGAGIVPGSDPQAEAEETGAKFGAMMSALGIDPRGSSRP